MSICLGTRLGIFYTAHIGPTRKRCSTSQTHRHRGTTTRHSSTELAPVRSRALRLARKVKQSPHPPLSRFIPDKNHFSPNYHDTGCAPVLGCRACGPGNQRQSHALRPARRAHHRTPAAAPRPVSCGWRPHPASPAARRECVSSEVPAEPPSNQETVGLLLSEATLRTAELAE